MSALPALRQDFMNVRIDALSMGSTMDRLLGWCRGEDRRSRIIVTVNVAIMMMMRSDTRLAAAIRSADLVVADGAPIVWASRWLSPGLPERVTGVDLMVETLARGSACGLRVFLLGTTQARLGTLMTEIGRRYPGIVIAGARNGYFDSSQEEDVVREIRESGADILLMGMPAPRKEIWSEMHRHQLDVPVVLGVGGSFDVLAGFVSRAPLAVQRAGLEWLWRLGQEPRKLWKRYLTTNTRFLVLLMGEMATRALFPAQRARRVG